jgi:type IV secretory pathway TrbL component
LAFVPALAIAGAAISAAGTVMGGIAQHNAAAYQAQVASNNSIIAQQNATRAEQAGFASAENQSRKNAAMVGKIKASQAASGIDVNTGSAVDVQAGERETGQLETETVFQNDLLKAYGYRTQATNFQAESELDTAKSEEAIPAAALSATGGLLSSASGIGGKWGNPSIPANGLFGGGSPSGYGTG